MVWLVEETKRSPETEKFPRSPRRFRTTTFERHVSDAIISRFPNPTTGFPHTTASFGYFSEVRVGNFPARFLSRRRLGARLSWYWLRSRPWEVAASGSNPTYLQKTLPGTPDFHFLMSVYNTEAIVASGVLPGRFTKYPMRTAVLKEKEEGKICVCQRFGFGGTERNCALGRVCGAVGRFGRGRDPGFAGDTRGDRADATQQKPRVPRVDAIRQPPTRPGRVPGMVTGRV